MSGKIVCIVDGLNPAVLTSLLLRDTVIDFCIIEERERPFIRNRSMSERLIIDLILAEMNIKILYVEKLPNVKTMSLKKDLVQILKVKRMVSGLIKSYPFYGDKTVTYYGASTSTFMSFLPVDEKQIIHLDHGLECLSRVNPAIGFKSSVWQNILIKLFDLQHFPNENLIGKGYTLTNCLNDKYVHKNYLDFENKNISLLLSKAVEFCGKLAGSLTLFLPITQFDYGINRRTIGADAIKLPYRKIYRNIFIRLKGLHTQVLVKFHHNFYLQGSNRANQEMELIRDVASEFSIRCFHIDEIDVNNFVKLLPAELIVKYLSIQRVIMMGSTTGLNLASENGKVHCISYVEPLKGFSEQYMDTYERVNPYIEYWHDKNEH